MDNDLKETLSALLKAELSPVIMRLDGIDSRLGGIDSRLDSMDSRLDGVDSRLDSMDSRLDGIDSRLDSMDSRLNGIDSRLDSVDSRLDGIDTRLGKLEVEQSQIKQAVLETNETVKRMEVIQEQQHAIIQLLSVRSIEQEAKIKHIL
ncbi:hypothetical protein BC351_31875 [Paenibacillus ferrarius]|uniref:t-SNARE coiled-coil homology domain-containing protein n=1 Tax=Paenibacillus ferrarius TaxID=1469647 RepID=A0A1V4HFU5_9BACL|nr:hypothetical protein [Paenibacillus ferrarius]OPH54576.1 hypothetical protein BC351_31875 [Paenibacillus ferrarius]